MICSIAVLTKLKLIHTVLIEAQWYRLQSREGVASNIMQEWLLLNCPSNNRGIENQTSHCQNMPVCGPQTSPIYECFNCYNKPICGIAILKQWLQLWCLLHHCRSSCLIARTRKAIIFIPCLLIGCVIISLFAAAASHI